MAKKIALYGGNSIYTLGPASDITFFFRCIEHMFSKLPGKPKVQLITDRLYRYYLHLEELNTATEEMQLVQQVFKTQKASQLDWHALGLVAAETELSLNNGDLSEVFATYFSSFDKAKESALSFLEAFGRYNPVRLVFANLPGFATDKRRKLSEYDANQSTPFWAR